MVVTGSCKSVMKYDSSEHTVSHVVEFDIKRRPELKAQHTISYNEEENPDFHEILEEIRCKCPNNYIWFHSKPFTAKDDGAVRWQLSVEDANPENPEEELIVRLNIERKPTDCCVFFYAIVTLQKDGPFSKKPDGESFLAHIENGLDSTVSQDSPELNIFSLSKNNAQTGFRLDLTYVIVNAFTGSEPPHYLMVTQEFSSPASDEILQPINLNFLLENPVASDITIKGNGKEWQLHKCILAARSKVFAAMFTTDMKEKTADSLESSLKDVDSKAMDVVIKYIYSNRIEKLEDVVLDVLVISDFYDLPELKRVCEAMFKSQLNIQNCLSTLTNTRKYSTDIAEFAKKYICDNLQEICKTDAWKDFIQKEVQLSTEIISERIEPGK